MYMFRSKRSNLTRRLLRARLDREWRGERGEANDVCVLLLKRLKEAQLELLLAAVESAGEEDVGACVLVSRAGCGPGGALEAMCRAWRWPDLSLEGSSTAQLRRLPSCASAQDPVYLCCNPYHLSRIARLHLNGK